MKKLLLIIFVLLNLTSVSLADFPIQINNIKGQELKTYRIINALEDNFLYVGGNTRVDKNLGNILKWNSKIIINTNNKYKWYQYNNTNNCKTINKKQKDLLLAIPHWEIKRKWNKENIIWNKKNFVCFKYKDQILAPGIPQNYTPDIAVLEDIKFVANNYEIILEDIESINIKDNANLDTSMLRIRNYLKNNITYDEETVSDENIENRTVEYKDAPWFYMKSYYENWASVCWAISNVFGMYVNYLGLTNMERVRWDVYFQSNVGHGLLKDDLGLYYDLTWNLGKERNDFFALDKNKIQVYFSSKGEWLKIKNNFDFELSKQLYKNNKSLFIHHINNILLLMLSNPLILRFLALFLFWFGCFLYFLFKSKIKFFNQKN